MSSITADFKQSLLTLSNEPMITSMESAYGDCMEYRTRFQPINTGKQVFSRGLTYLYFFVDGKLLGADFVRINQCETKRPKCPSRGQ